jgi:hypothetical protein
LAVSHIKSNSVADWTGTVTVGDSAGATKTVAATDLLRPGDWNSAHNQFYTLSGNTNNASTASGTNVVFQGVGAVTVAGSTGTIGISVAPAVTNRHYYPFDEAVHFATQQNASLFFMPFAFPNIQHDRFCLRISHTNATNSSGSWTMSNWVGLYTRNASTLSLLSSTSTSHAVTNSGTAGVFSSVGGQRVATIPWTNTITQGDYWVGMVSRTTSGGADCTVQGIYASQLAAAHSGLFSVASNATAQRRLGQGVYSVTTAGMPASVAFADIRGSNSDAHRPPVFFFLSQTA